MLIFLSAERDQAEAIGQLVGSVVGVVLMISIVAAVAAWLIKRKKKKEEEELIRRGIVSPNPTHK
jgi:VIT1/CCC1 family predicted Fe2+/Mn2+ transporter